MKKRDQVFRDFGQQLNDSKELNLWVKLQEIAPQEYQERLAESINSGASWDGSELPKRKIMTLNTESKLLWIESLADARNTALRKKAGLKSIERNAMLEAQALVGSPVVQDIDDAMYNRQNRHATGKPRTKRPRGNGLGNGHAGAGMPRGRTPNSYSGSAAMEVDEPYAGNMRSMTPLSSGSGTPGSAGSTPQGATPSPDDPLAGWDGAEGADSVMIPDNNRDY